MALGREKFAANRERRKYRLLLEDWYGREAGRIEMTGHDAPVRSIGELNDELIAKLCPEQIHDLIYLDAHWRELVGPQFAALVKFSSLYHGVLFLEVRHSAFMQEELLKSADLLIARINEKMKKNICSEIRFVPQGRRG